jgi:hypothetical protein
MKNKKITLHEKVGIYKHNKKNKIMEEEKVETVEEVVVEDNTCVSCEG